MIKSDINWETYHWYKLAWMADDLEPVFDCEYRDLVVLEFASPDSCCPYSATYNKENYLYTAFCHRPHGHTGDHVSLDLKAGQPYLEASIRFRWKA